MADETGPNVDGTADAGVDGDGDELRHCCYCGTDLHPSSYRCHDCGGVVALGWGTALKEHFLFLFISILIAVGCATSWAQRFPAGAMIDKTIMVEAPPVLGAPGLAPNAPKPMVEKTIQVAPEVESLNGLQTIRGSFMFAIALYGIFVAIFNLLHRRMIVWPFFLNGVVALEVGLTSMSRCMNSTAWDLWTKKTADMNWVETWLGKFRAVPASQLLLTFAGAIVLISIIKGVVGGFAAGAAKSKEKQAASSDATEARRQARESRKKDSGTPETPV